MKGHTNGPAVERPLENERVVGSHMWVKARARGECPVLYAAKRTTLPLYQLLQRYTPT